MVELNQVSSWQYPTTQGNCVGASTTSFESTLLNLRWVDFVEQTFVWSFNILRFFSKWHNTVLFTFSYVLILFLNRRFIWFFNILRFFWSHIILYFLFLFNFWHLIEDDKLLIQCDSKGRGIVLEVRLFTQTNIEKNQRTYHFYDLQDCIILNAIYYLDAFLIWNQLQGEPSSLNYVINLCRLRIWIVDPVNLCFKCNLRVENIFYVNPL